MKLTAKPEKQILTANGTDLCYIPIEFTDETGLLLPAVEQRVEISVEGTAKLIGFGSALYKTDELFDQTHHNSYRGRCLAIVKAGTDPGTVRVSVKSAGVKSTEVLLTVQ